MRREDGRRHLARASPLDLLQKAVRRRERVFHDLLRERAAARVLASEPDAGRRVLSALASGELDPYAAVEALLGPDDLPASRGVA